MEILEYEPVGVEDFFRFRTIGGLEDAAFEVVVGHTVFRAAADVIEAVPELRRHLVAADALEQTAGVLHGGPFQHALDGHVEHDGVEVLEDAGVEDARLPQADPVLDAGVGEDAFGDDLADAVAVELTGTDGVAGASPVQGFVAVGGLRHRTDIDGLDVGGIRLREDGLHHVLGGGDVHFQGLFGEIVRRGGDHAAHVQHDVRARDAREDVLIVHQVAPHDADLVRQGCKFFLVFWTFASQNGHVVLFGESEQLLQSCPSHGAGRAGEEYGLLHFSV